MGQSIEGARRGQSIHERSADLTTQDGNTIFKKMRRGGLVVSMLDDVS